MDRRIAFGGLGGLGLKCRVWCVMERGAWESENTALSASDALPATAAGFAGVYRAHSSHVRRFLARSRIEPAYLDDLVQEVFLRAWTGRNGYRGKAHIKTWLCAIAYNVAREWQRKGVASRAPKREVTAEDTVGRAMADRERAQAIRTAVEQLPPKQRQAIKLVYFEMLEASEAAAKAECNLQVFRWRLADAREQLRRLMGNEVTDTDLL